MMFLIFSSFGASGRLCFVIVAFPVQRLHLYFVCTCRGVSNKYPRLCGEMRTHINTLELHCLKHLWDHANLL